MAAPFHLDILAASVPFYRGDCVSLVLPTTDGEYGILADHRMAACCCWWTRPSVPRTST